MGDSRKFAVITGASSGIGLELGRQFAEHGHDLLICAEDDGVHSAAQELQQLGVEVTAVQEDLRKYDSVERLYAAITASGRPVDAAALNAGIGRGGAFLDTDLQDELSIIELNIASTVHLAKRVVGEMARRRAGRLLITSSIAATTPGSFQAVYNASKAFLQSFAVALQDELKDIDVTVTSLMPGPTETNFFRRAQMATNTRIGRSSKDDPADVAAQGYAALMAGRNRVVASSLSTKAMETVSSILPDRVKATMHRVMAKPR